MSLKIPQSIKHVMDSLGGKAQSSHGGRHDGHDHDHDHEHSFTEAELLERMEEFNRNAELYWQKTASDPLSRAAVMNKPFSALLEMPRMIYRLGLVMAEMHLGLGHTVLDFGAGSCWTSSFLNQVGCRTIAMDVSPTALMLGQELFQMDPRHRMDLDPQFLPYDGHKIPLPSESVDRVLCFDSFHHVPNQDEVLSELYRVLKTGGRVVFAEPGEGHSHTALSHYEMENYGVLENEMSMPDLIKKCKNLGFTDVLIKPYPDAATITFSSSEYLQFMNGETGLYPMETLKASMRSFYIFILTKGPEVFDSRSPKTLKADIRLGPTSQPLKGQSGTRLPLPITIKNDGDTIWLHEKNELGGYIMLGGHLYNAQHELLSLGYFRAPLPQTLAPNESLNMQADLPLPTEPGHFFIKLDMVDEAIQWFQQVGSPTTEIEVFSEGLPDTRGPGRVHARIEPLATGQPAQGKPGAKITLPVRITNIGNTIWLHLPDQSTGRTALSGHLYNGQGELISRGFFRTPLGQDVAPDESVEVQARFPGPVTPGKYFVRFDLVAENVCWFADRGSKPTEIEIEITNETPDSTNPGILQARIELSEPGQAISAKCGSRLSIPVRTVNTGNTIWLHKSDGPGGYVTLGGHLYDEKHNLLAYDLPRTPLPKSVGLGESLDLNFEYETPARPGRYFLELDLVDEQIIWFRQAGSPTAEIEIIVK